MIAGEELDMDMSQLEFVMADTGARRDAKYRAALGEQHDQEHGGGSARGGSIGEAGAARAGLDAARRADLTALGQ